jgi:hypothetical protein
MTTIIPNIIKNLIYTTIYPRARFAKDFAFLQIGQKTPTGRAWGTISAGL